MTTQTKTRKAFKPLMVVNLSFKTYKQATGKQPFREPDTATMKAIQLQSGQRISEVQEQVSGKFKTPDYCKVGAKASIGGSPANGTAVLFNGTTLKFKSGAVSQIINPVK